MRIVVSACLLGENCKYSGGNNLDGRLAGLLEGHEVLPLCPEMAGGLPCPRPCAEQQGDRVVNTEGCDVTEAFERGARICAERAAGCDLAVLQPRSPSCGVHQVYDGTFSGRLVPGEGVFARVLRLQGIPCHEPADPRLADVLRG